jgi:hypothetical protein
MKLKSLFLGSVTAVGLSSGAFAADLATVVSSFDVCENLGMSGLTISSSDDCLQISGKVSYEFNWGDYAGTQTILNYLNYTRSSATVMDNDGTAPSTLDWGSDVDWWLQFVGAAQSDFGTAKAVIKFEQNDDEIDVENEGIATAESAGVAINVKEAYVSVGDTTQLVAGRRDTSVFQTGDDEPFNFLGLFHNEAVDDGVNALSGRLDTKGHVIQLYHAIGDTGITVSAGLENLQNDNGAGQGSIAAAHTFATPNVTDGKAGTAVGTIAYAGDNFVGHASMAAGGVLDGYIEDWKAHVGGTATFDNFKVRGAFAAASSTVGGATWTEWNGMVTASATFDMFTLAGSLEAAHQELAGTTTDQWGGGASASAAVTDEVTLTGGFRWYDTDTTTANTETWQAALQLVAKLTETLTATGEVGYYDVGTAISTTADNYYGALELAWEPGGQFNASIKGEVNSLGGYKATFKASKQFD